MGDNILFKLQRKKKDFNMIKVIGVGGGGGSAVNHMYNRKIKGVDFALCNTDLQDLEGSPVSTKVHLGKDPLGIGAGADPKVGAKAAIHSKQDIEKLFDQNTRMVFVTAGMGGGTGTGAAPIVSKIAKEKDLLVIGVVTSPFSWEGIDKMENAQKGIEEMRKYVDALIVINNDKLEVIHGDLGISDAYQKADEVLLEGVKGIAEVITEHYKQNIDLQDARTVLKDSKNALMGTATAKGENRAIEAIKGALNSPLLEVNNIRGAKKVLLLIVSGKKEITGRESAKISNYIQAAAGGGNKVQIIPGYGRDDSEDNVSVTIVITGFGSENDEVNTDVHHQGAISEYKENSFNLNSQNNEIELEIDNTNVDGISVVYEEITVDKNNAFIVTSKGEDDQVEGKRCPLQIMNGLDGSIEQDFNIKYKTPKLEITNKVDTSFFNKPIDEEELKKRMAVRAESLTEFNKRYKVNVDRNYDNLSSKKSVIKECENKSSKDVPLKKDNEEEGGIIAKNNYLHRGVD